MKISVEIDKPRRCGECPFYSEREYRCHNEVGKEAYCSKRYMNDDMREKSFKYTLYEGCKLFK